MNFGWPCYEGSDTQFWYQIATPSRLSCSWSITAEDPVLPTGPARFYAHPRPDVNDPPGSVGNAIMGGAFYTGRAYPSRYHNRLFYADYGSGWIRTAIVDTLDQIVADSVFALDAAGAVDFASDPRSGDLYFIQIYTNQIMRLRYTGNDGLDHYPIAHASGTPLVGVAPFEVSFDAGDSQWADGTTPSISWNFGDGLGSGFSEDVHVYQRPGIYSAVLTIDDNMGGVSRDTLEVVVFENGRFPGTPILDAFNRADGPLGSDWIAENEGLSVNGGTLAVNDAVAGAVWAAAESGPDQEAYVSFVNDPLPDATYGLLLKAQGDAAGGTIEVRYRAGAGVVVGTTGRRLPFVASGDSIPAAFEAGDLLGARAYANGIVQVFRNGALLGERSVASWRYARAGGRIGVKLAGSLGTRFDDFGGGNVVVQGDLPPVATLSAPLNNSFYVAGDTIHLAAEATDDRDAPSALAYAWTVDIAHNNHIHPGVFTAIGPTASFVAEDHDDGTGAHYVIRVRVTDTNGLSDSKRVDIYPEVDLEPTMLSIDPDLSTPNFDASVSFTIMNHGRMLAPRSRWQVSFDTTVVAYGDTIVAAGGSVAITVPVGENLDTGFPRRINATADALDFVHELNEENNTIGLPIRPIGRFGGQTALTAPRLTLISPNPSRNGVAFTLELPGPQPVRFSVYDLQGRTVWSAPATTRPAGRFELAWEGRDAAGGRAAPGLYFARVEIGGQRFIRRFAILR
jgi:PKD repeat protein